MIKLGVLDLDGTLLDNEGRLPKSFWRDLETLQYRNVHVAIASARPAQFLFEMFDRDTELLISGEDGNIFFSGKKLLHARYISHDLITMANNIVAQCDDLAIACTGPDGMFVTSENYSRFVRWGMGRFMPDSPNPMTGQENICKIHVFCRNGADEAGQMVSSAFADMREYADIHEAGYGWIGITEKNSNKAAAVRFFQDYLNVKNDETAVFGDSSNDIPMFQLTPHSFAMKNASEDIRHMAANVTADDNEHNGAMKTLLKITE